MTEAPRSEVELASATTADGPWWTPALLASERAGRSADALAPSWVTLAEAAIAAAGTAPSCTPTVVGPDRAQAEALFAPVVAPFVTVALAPVDAALATAAHLVDPAVGTCVAAELTALLCRTVARAMVAELQAGSTKTSTPGDDVASRAAFDEIVARTATTTGLAALLARYPVLARLLAVQSAHRADAVLEVLERFADDRADVVEHLLAGTDPGLLSELSLGAGDSHQQGRSVSLLRFAGGATVVYKPRPLSVHLAFDRVLDVVRAQAPDVTPRAASVLTRDGYGWMEFVASGPCRTVGELASFYRRQGTLLAVAHAVRATDLHCENIIASGSHPVIIDLETVLHPDRTPSAQAIPDPSRAALGRSVLRTSMLPWHNTGPDLSGFGGAESVVGSLVHYDDAGLLSMALRRDRGTFEGAQNRPVLDGVPAQAADHVAEILVGFRTAYDVLTRSRALLLGADGAVDALGREPGRVVLRNTATYARLLDECTHPSVLGTATARETVLRRLAAQEGPAERAVQDSELDQLWQGDVPVFETRPGLRGIFAATGRSSAADQPVSDGPDAPASAREVIAGLSSIDRDSQAWIIAAALASRARAALPDDAAAERPAGATSALSAALAVADRIIADADDDGRRCNWLSLYRHPDDSTSVLPMGADLANGYLGVALFLAQVADLTGRDRHRDFASRAVVDLPELITRLVGNPAWARAVGAGALHGAGGIAYATARLARLLPGHELAGCVDAAVRLVRLASAAPDLTIATGRAGGLLALLAIHAEGHAGAGVAAAEVAAALAADLDSAAAPSSEGGLLHGRLGVIWALARAGAQLEDADLTAGAARALAAEPALDWAALSPGFAGLAGLALVTAEVDPTGFAARRLRAAVEARLSDSALPDDSLTTGEAGLLDVSLLLSDGDCRPASGDRAETSMLRARRGAQLAQTVASGRLALRCSTPAGVATPGLLYGLAGIGFGLLRLHDPESVPSVLAFDSVVNFRTAAVANPTIARSTDRVSVV